MTQAYLMNTQNTVLARVVGNYYVEVTGDSWRPTVVSSKDPINGTVMAILVKGVLSKRRVVKFGVKIGRVVPVAISSLDKI